MGAFAKGALVMAALVISWTSIAGAQPAPAQPPAAQASEPARLYNLAMEALRGRHYEEGLGFLRRSYALHPAAVVAWQLGLTYFEMDRLVEAQEQFETFLQDATEAQRQENGVEAHDHLTDIARRVGHVRVTTLEPESARMTVDGRGVSLDTGRDVPVDPGEHIVAAESEGHQRQWQRVRVPSGQRVDVQFTLAPTLAAGGASHPVYTQWWFWTGVAAVVTAAVVVPIAVESSRSTEPLPLTNTGWTVDALTASGPVRR